MLALTEALFANGVLILLVSRSYRQSRELFRIVVEMYARLNSPMLVQRNAQELVVAPDLMYSQANYARSYYALGLMKKNLGKHAEARGNFEKSRQIREQIREQLLRDFGKTEFATMLQIDLLFSLMALGEHEKAVSIADKLGAGFPLGPVVSGTSYRLACVYSLSVAAVAEARAPAPLTAPDKQRQTEYRAKALTALERSHTLGNRDFANTRLDADFAPIRADPRFAKILELEKKQPK